MDCPLHFLIPVPRKKRYNVKNIIYIIHRNTNAQSLGHIFYKTSECPRVLPEDIFGFIFKNITFWNVIFFCEFILTWNFSRYLELFVCDLVSYNEIHSSTLCIRSIQQPHSRIRTQHTNIRGGLTTWIQDFSE